MKKRLNDGFLFAICFAILLVFFPFSSLAGKDVLSVNIGGGSQLSVSSGQYTSGGNFFSEISPVLTSVPSTPGSTVSAGGASAGGTNIIVNSFISVNVTSLNISLVNNTNSRQYILVTNTGAAAAQVSVLQSNLTGIAMIQGNSTFTLAGGESRVITILFIGPQAIGVYKGSLNIAGKNIPVQLNVQQYLTMFDTKIEVTNPNYIVVRGKSLETKVTLNPKGNTPVMDVTINYSIKDSSGKVYFSKSETVQVKSETVFNKKFDTGQLPPGNYTIFMDVFYPYGSAPASARFEVVESKTLIGQVIYYLLLGILVLSIVIVSILIRRTLKKGKKSIKKDLGKIERKFKQFQS